MLRLLRAMQFLVLLIEQAPSRVAEERERLDKLLATAIDNISKMSAASEDLSHRSPAETDGAPGRHRARHQPRGCGRQNQ